MVYYEVFGCGCSLKRGWEANMRRKEDTLYGWSFSCPN